MPFFVNFEEKGITLRILHLNMTTIPVNRGLSDGFSPFSAVILGLGSNVCIFNILWCHFNVKLMSFFVNLMQRPKIFDFVRYFLNSHATLKNDDIRYQYG